MKRLSFFSASILLGAVMLAGCSDLAANLAYKDGQFTGGVTFHLRDDGFVQETLDSLSKIAVSAKTEVAQATFSNIGEITVGVLEKLPADADVVFVVDNTGSMGWAIDSVKSDVTAALKAAPGRHYGVVAYRDRADDYVAKTMAPLGPDTQAAVDGIAAMSADQGGDFPESVAVGLDEALGQTGWSADKEKHIILIGDAPDHAYTDDPITMDSVLARATKMGVVIHAVGLPCGDTCKEEIGTK